MKKFDAQVKLILEFIDFSDDEIRRYSRLYWSLHGQSEVSTTKWESLLRESSVDKSELKTFILYLYNCCSKAVDSDTISNIKHVIKMTELYYYSNVSSEPSRRKISNLIDI